MKINITPIISWFQLAKPKPTIADACVQIGCHYEEVSEMMSSLSDDAESVTIDYLSGEYKDKSSYNINNLTDLTDDEKTELLDALCDQIVTAVGAGHMMGFDISKALEEVNKSNWSKFENGKPLFDENGKVKKGKNYQEPQLQEFIK